MSWKTYYGSGENDRNTSMLSTKEFNGDENKSLKACSDLTKDATYVSILSTKKSNGDGSKVQKTSSDFNEDKHKKKHLQIGNTDSNLDLEDCSHDLSNALEVSGNDSKNQRSDEHFEIGLQASVPCNNLKSCATNLVENEVGKDGEQDNYIYIKFKNGKDNNHQMVTGKSNFSSKSEDQAEASGSTSGTSNPRKTDKLPWLLPSDDGFMSDYLPELDEDDDGNPWGMDLQQLYNNDRDILHILEDQGIFDLDQLPSRLQELSEPDYPCNKKIKGTCDICYTENTDVRKRLCCDKAVCEPCQKEYLKSQVVQRNVTMQCISCDSYVHRDEILALLPMDTKEKYSRFLNDDNQDPNAKTCPRCSVIQNRNDIVIIHSPGSKKKHKKVAKGLKVTCPKCALVWCFDCHAPWHQDIKCKEYRKGDKLVKSWAKEFCYGQKNAVKCPKCKVLIQKISGCSHMTCCHCSTSFCYRCGQRYHQMKLIGKHSDRYSPFGCKYNLLPERPAARKAVRGGVLCAKILGGIGLGVLIVSAVAIFIGGSVIFVPAYLVDRYRQERKRQNFYRNMDRVKHPDKQSGKDGSSELPEDLPSFQSYPSSTDTMTSTESGSSSDHNSTEVKVWVHSEGDQESVEVVQFKSQEQQTTVSKHDNNVTTAEVTMDKDLVVLHVKTTNKPGEVNTSKQEVDGSGSQPEENKDVTEEMTIADKADITVDTQGCFVKILGKLPVKWDKEEGKEVNIKDNIVSAKTAIVKKRKIGTRRNRSVDIPDQELIKSGNGDGNDEVKISEIHNALHKYDETDPYYGLVALETCDTGF